MKSGAHAFSHNKRKLRYPRILFVLFIPYLLALLRHFSDVFRVICKFENAILIQ